MKQWEVNLVAILLVVATLYAEVLIIRHHWHVDQMAPAQKLQLWKELHE